MINIVEILKTTTVQAVQDLYGAGIDTDSIIINDTKKEFEGDVTVVVFPVVRFAKKKPEEAGKDIGDYLKANLDFIADFNVIKGFLNLSLYENYWLHIFNDISIEDNYGQFPDSGKTVVLEYIGPNTNKPLHLGHLRNMFTGYATANILKANGHNVHKVNIYNDRGIAVCKSMAAWLESANGETPESSGMKGDFFVGKYYVEYSKLYDTQLQDLLDNGLEKKEAEKQVPIKLKAQDLLLKWEAGEEATRKLWKQMNDWVYTGFNETYKKLGVDYEKAYCESDTYLLGKEMVEKGLAKGVFFAKRDGSVWVDLSDRKLDEKLLLRSDGTSVYITQDLGVAKLRYEDYQMDESIYVVGDEQNYHFKVLKETLDVLGEPYAKGIHHLSYGMVDLPTGKMKSREGTTVDADDLVAKMLDTAEEHTAELGKTEGMDEAEAKELYRIIGLGALKYFILKVNPKKRMLFNPKESIELVGHTGPFIQYTHARIQSVMRKYKGNYHISFDFDNLQDAEKEVIVQLYKYPDAIQEAATEYDPSVIANYVYQLAKSYNRFYNEHQILGNLDEIKKQFPYCLVR